MIDIHIQSSDAKYEEEALRSGAKGFIHKPSGNYYESQEREQILDIVRESPEDTKIMVADDHPFWGPDFMHDIGHETGRRMMLATNLKLTRDRYNELVENRDKAIIFLDVEFQGDKRTGLDFLRETR